MPRSSGRTRRTGRRGNRRTWAGRARRTASPSRKREGRGEGGRRTGGTRNTPRRCENGVRPGTECDEGRTGRGDHPLLHAAFRPCPRRTIGGGGDPQGPAFSLAGGRCLLQGVPGRHEIPGGRIGRATARGPEGMGGREGFLPPGTGGAETGPRPRGVPPRTQETGQGGDQPRTPERGTPF